jgi:hypothetical protein
VPRGECKASNHQLQQQVIELADLEVESAVDAQHAAAQLGKNFIGKDGRHLSANQFTICVHHKAPFHSVNVSQGGEYLFHGGLNEFFGDLIEVRFRRGHETGYGFFVEHTDAFVLTPVHIDLPQIFRSQALADQAQKLYVKCERGL